MKYFFATAASLLLVLFSISPAFAASSEGKAGIVVPLDIYYDTYTTGTTTKTTTTFTNLDAAVGYRFNMGLYLGASYFYQTIDVNNGSDTTTTNTYYAPEIGFMDKGWMARLGYIPSVAESKTTTGSVNTSYDNGSGFYVDFGYEFMLGEHFGIGPSVKYYDITFTKQTVAGVQTTLTNNYEAKGLDPYLMLVFHF